jgi:hypothetical protein
MANFFDQFDAPAQTSGNFFDQFDTPSNGSTFNERFGEMAAPAAQPGMVENALKPITS